MGYPTAEDLAALSNRSEITDAEPEALEILRRSAIGAIEAFTRQSFEEETTTLTLDGSGKRTLYLPRRLATFTGIAFRSEDLDADGFLLSDDHSRLSFSEAAWGSWASRAVAELEFGGPLSDFAPGVGNIAITGTWGWLDAEWEAGELDAVTYALVADMEDTAIAEAGPLADSVRAARAQGVNSISQGNLNVNLIREPDVSRKVANLLRGVTPGGERLVWTNLAGATV